MAAEGVDSLELILSVIASFRVACLKSSNLSVNNKVLNHPEENWRVGVGHGCIPEVGQRDTAFSPETAQCLIVQA